MLYMYMLVKTTFSAQNLFLTRTMPGIRLVNLYIWLFLYLDGVWADLHPLLSFSHHQEVDKWCITHLYHAYQPLKLYTICNIWRIWLLRMNYKVYYMKMEYKSFKTSYYEKCVLCSSKNLHKRKATVRSPGCINVWGHGSYRWLQEVEQKFGDVGRMRTWRNEYKSD